MAARRTRLGLVRTFASAVRTARRPGSAGFTTRVRALPRLLAAVSSGEYTAARPGALIGLAAALAYVLSPVDLVPEALVPVLGLGDDTLVLAWAAAQLVEVTEDFLRWERQPRRATGADDPATATVTGRVVR